MSDKNTTHKLNVQGVGCVLLVIFWLVVIGIFFSLGIGG